MAPSSVKKYRVILDQLRRFYTLIGCYNSLLITLNPMPRVCPSMDVSDVVLFMKYKYNVCGTTLMRNGAAVLDVSDRPVYCSGAWNAPGLLESYAAAVGAERYQAYRPALGKIKIKRSSKFSYDVILA